MQNHSRDLQRSRSLADSRDDLQRSRSRPVEKFDENDSNPNKVNLESPSTVLYQFCNKSDFSKEVVRDKSVYKVSWICHNHWNQMQSHVFSKLTGATEEWIYFSGNQLWTVETKDSNKPIPDETVDTSYRIESPSDIGLIGNQLYIKCIKEGRSPSQYGLKGAFNRVKRTMFSTRERKRKVVYIGPLDPQKAFQLQRPAGSAVSYQLPIHHLQEGTTTNFRPATNQFALAPVASRPQIYPSRQSDQNSNHLNHTTGNPKNTSTSKNGREGLEGASARNQNNKNNNLNHTPGNPSNTSTPDENAPKETFIVIGWLKFEKDPNGNDLKFSDYFENATNHKTEINELSLKYEFFFHFFR